jgi:hypothetical protein
VPRKYRHGGKGTGCVMMQTSPAGTAGWLSCFDEPAQLFLWSCVPEQ